MSEEIRENLNPKEFETAVTSGDDFAPKKSAKPEKPQKTKAHRMTKEEKQAAREAAKNKSKAQKAWEDSIVANKRVKREEINRKLKKAMLILLTFSLALTSTVYVMLLFIDANNVRITATNTIDKAITMSFDKVNWTPYLDVDGPDNMWNISYNPDYKTTIIPPSKEKVSKALIDGAEQGLVGGNHSAQNLIEFCFYVRNASEILVPYTMEMSLESNDKGLEDSMRVMWAMHVIGTDADRADRPQTQVNVYASLSEDARLAYNNGVEKIAYPAGVEMWSAEQMEKFDIQGQVLNYQGAYEPWKNPTDVNGNVLYADFDHFCRTTGFEDTTPFANDEFVLQDQSYLDISEMVCVYVCVWIEGSDLDCTDNALDGYVTLSIKFTTI